MRHQEYIKIFAGSSIAVLAIKQALLEENIIPVVKDQSESGRLAGFGAAPGYQEVFVHPDEGGKSLGIVNSIWIHNIIRSKYFSSLNKAA